MKDKEIISLVIADDHLIFRDGLKLLFRKDDNIRLAGEAGNGKELLEVVKSTRPDIVMTDIVMPEMNGIDAVKEILKLYPDTGIIALTMVDDDDMLLEILEAGALGYLLKNAEKEEIIDAILSVKNGEPFYSTSISEQMVKLVGDKKDSSQIHKKTIMFSDKEIEIITLICTEKTNKQISEKLYYSIRTIEWYRAKILEKMQVKSTAGIVAYAIKNKLCKL